MNVLFVGQGQGSWQIRGVQIAQALGAHATTAPTAAEFAVADVIVLVKHAAERWGRRAADTGKPIIWDVLDWWTQPDANTLPMADHIAAVKRQAASIGVRFLIGATQIMAEDLGGVYLPHHSRPGLRPAPTSEALQVVAYEGTRKYLGSWKAALETACATLGLTFVINPPDLRDADVVVAFRGERWHGDVCERWKSGVKAVNAVAAGRPLLSQPSAGVEDVQPCGTRLTDPAHLNDVLRMWQSHAYRERVRVHSVGRLRDFTMHAIADQYRAVLRSVVREAA